jgi:hypothetical protein
LGFFRRTVNDLLKEKNHAIGINILSILSVKGTKPPSFMPAQATEEKRSNRKLLLLFLVGILIALLPWLVLAAS